MPRRVHALPLCLVLAVNTGCGARSSVQLADTTGGSPDSRTRSCVGANSTPTEVVALPPNPNFCAGPSAVAVEGANLYYGVFIECGEANGTGGIWRVATGGGTPELIDGTNYDYGPIVHDAERLYFPKVTLFPTTSSSAHTAVGALALTGGPTSVLPNPSSSSQLYVTDVTATDATGAFWLVGNADTTSPMLLARADGAQTSLVGTISAWTIALVVAGDQVFAQSSQALWSVPLAGGEGTMVRPLTTKAALLGASGGAVFFSPEGTSIVRCDAASGVETVLVTGATISIASYANRVAAWVDEAWVYWAEYEKLQRVAVGGGAVQVLADQPGRVVEAITSDACNVYWGVTQLGDTASPVILAMGKN